MTPAIRLLERHATPHEVLQYPHDPPHFASMTGIDSPGLRRSRTTGTETEERS